MNVPDTIPSARTWTCLAAKVLAALGCALGAVLVVGATIDSQLRANDSTQLDHTIAVWFVEHRTSALTTWWKTVTWLGSSAVVIPLTVLVVVLLLRSRHQILALYLTLAVAGGALLNALAKQVIGRQRPPVSSQLQHAFGSSFPSGHTTQATATYLGLAVVVGVLASSKARRTAVRAIATVACVMVGLSRIYLGVHWATDVLAGWLLGVVWIATLTLAFKASSQRITKPPAHSPGTRGAPKLVRRRADVERNYGRRGRKGLLQLRRRQHLARRHAQLEL